MVFVENVYPEEGEKLALYTLSFFFKSVTFGAANDSADSRNNSVFAIVSVHFPFFFFVFFLCSSVYIIISLESDVPFFTFLSIARPKLYPYFVIYFCNVDISLTIHSDR